MLQRPGFDIVADNLSYSFTFTSKQSLVSHVYKNKDTLTLNVLIYQYAQILPIINLLHVRLCEETPANLNSPSACIRHRSSKYTHNPLLRVPHLDHHLHATASTYTSNACELYRLANLPHGTSELVTGTG